MLSLCKRTCMSGENVLGTIFQNANGSTVFLYQYRFLHDLIIVKKQSEKRCQHVGQIQSCVVLI